MKGLSRLALTVGALLGAGMVGAFVLGLLLGIRPVVLTSGSMAPALPTGALALDRATPVGEIEVGDVVTLPLRDGAWVTHRVVRIDHDRGGATIRLQGDANARPDDEVHHLAGDDTVELVVAHVPLLGRLLALLRSPLGLLALGALTVALLPVMWRGSPPRGTSTRRAPAGARHRRTVGVTALAAAVVVGSAGPGGAAWTDGVGVSGATLTAFTVVKPANLACTVTGGALVQKTATIVWDEVSAPHALDYTATIVETGQAMTVTDNGATSQTQFSAGLLSTVLNQTYTIRITASLPAPGGTWTAVAQQPVTIALLGLGLTCGTPS